MSLRGFLLVALLTGPLSFSGSAFAQRSEARDGARELALGREAYARGSYPEAVGHLSQAVQALGGGGEREALADAYLRLGMAHLIGLGAPAQALPAFLSSAELAGEPATAYLWAALAAEKLGQREVSERLEAKALAAAVPVPAPAPVQTPAAAPAAPREEPARAPEVKETEAEKVDAFQYFFGKKKQKPPAEKPPGL
ncbi:MAG TPA: hypothetical protein VEL74_14720 [Thermoanaerobaculia bacterium]|nr:hypothetical protein [Thermoanaerobaculia bacterium]